MPDKAAYLILKIFYLKFIAYEKFSMTSLVKNTLDLVAKEVPKYSCFFFLLYFMDTRENNTIKLFQGWPFIGDCIW